MNIICKSITAAAAVVFPLLAGGMFLEVSNPARDAEAAARHALLVVHVTACHSPEKSVLKATAESVNNGTRTSVPLEMAALSAAGRFAVLPGQTNGTMVLKVTSTNPEYANYKTAVLVPVADGAIDWARVKHFGQEPSETEVSTMMKSSRTNTVASN